MQRPQSGKGKPSGNGNGGRKPDLRIDAIIETHDSNGELKTVWVPIGAAWRTENGDFTAELRAEPPQWKHSPERRLFLRLTKNV